MLRNTVKPHNALLSGKMRVRASSFSDAATCYVADGNMPHACRENEWYRSILGIMGLTKASQGTDRPSRDQLKQSQEQDPKAS